MFKDFPTEKIPYLIVNMTRTNRRQIATKLLQDAVLSQVRMIQQAISLYSTAEEEPGKENEIAALRAFSEIVISFNALTEWFKAFSRNNLSRKEAEAVWSANFSRGPEKTRVDFSDCSEHRVM